MSENRTPGLCSLHVEHVLSKPMAAAELVRLVEGTASFSGQIPMLVGSDNLVVALTGCGPNGPGNARRLLAAWNTCDGIPVEVLEANAAGGLPWSVADQIEARLVRDKLLAALEEARTGLRWYQDRNPGQADSSDDEAMERINEAITKAGGSLE